jgi:hypothetical protein
VMTEVCSGGEKGRKCQVAWGSWEDDDVASIVPSLG